MASTWSSSVTIFPCGELSSFLIARSDHLYFVLILPDHLYFVLIRSDHLYFVFNPVWPFIFCFHPAWPFLCNFISLLGLTIYVWFYVFAWSDHFFRVLFHGLVWPFRISFWYAFFVFLFLRFKLYSKTNCIHTDRQAWGHSCRNGW